MQPTVHRPPRRPGHRPWQCPAAELLAPAPPQWAVAAPLRPALRRGGYRAALLLAATCGCAAIARAQVTTGGGDAGTGGTSAAGGGAGAAAPTGTAPSDAAPGSLRATIENVLPGTNQPVAGPNTAPAWIVTPAISLQEEWTDNALQTGTDHKSSLITVVQPSISINGTTSRLTADLFYEPSIQLYTPQSSQNQYGQNFGGDALLTVAPDEFYIKATGFATVQSVAGAIAPNGVTALSKQNAVQTYSFSVEPYVTHRFGGWGTAQVGVAAGETTTGAVNGGAAIQNLTSKEAFATFKSGENLGRLSSTLSFDTTQDTGTGALQGASQTTASYSAGYAITRDIIALASIGWENIRYTGPGAPHYDDATWSVGTQLLPNADSSIIVTYGHQNGATSAAVNASYAPTASIRLFAQYSAGVSSAAQSLNGALADATFDPLGRPIDAVTGATLLPASNFFGFNGNVYQSKSLSVTAALLWPRDTFQLTVQQQTQTPIGNAGQTVLAVARDTALGNIIESAGLAATSGTTGTISWQHDLSPVVSTNTSFQYGVLNNATPLILTNGVLTATGKQIQNARLLAFNAGVTWQINRTLSGTLQYSYTNDDYSNGLPGVAANLVVLGLRKSF
jgi:uncharacterized protein (PEP-CTERM system associated)